MNVCHYLSGQFCSESTHLSPRYYASAWETNMLAASRTFRAEYECEFWFAEKLLGDWQPGTLCSGQIGCMSCISLGEKKNHSHTWVSCRGTDVTYLGDCATLNGKNHNSQYFITSTMDRVRQRTYEGKSNPSIHLGILLLLLLLLLLLFAGSISLYASTTFIDWIIIPSYSTTRESSLIQFYKFICSFI